MKKHIEVVAGIIKNGDEILCMQRQLGKYDYVSLKWEFPGGKIENGETKEQALYREIQEEMEMDINIEKHFDDVSYEYPDFTITMYCFLCSAQNRKFVMNVHNDFKWVHRDEIVKLDWAPADIKIVNEIKDKGI